MNKFITSFFLALALAIGCAAAPPTSNFGLIKPDDADRNWGVGYRGNMDVIDSYLPGKELPMTTPGGVSAGDVVYILDTLGVATVSPADASSAASANVAGICVIATATDCLVQSSGFTPDALLAGLTRGVTYYLSDSTPGGITATPPSLPSISVVVGTAVDEDELLLLPRPDSSVILSNGGFHSYGLGTDVTLGPGVTTFNTSTSRVNITGDPGGNTVTTITCTGCGDGTELVIFFDSLGGSLIFQDAAVPGLDQLELGGGTYTPNLEGSITLVRTGIYWTEKCRAD